MFTLVRRIAILAVLLVMPLQGFAAALGPFMCFGHHDHHAGEASAHDHHDQAAERHATTSSDQQDDGGNPAKHLECHHVFSGMPMTFGMAVTPDLPIFQSNLSLLATLHIPERPQRPPRT